MKKRKILPVIIYLAVLALLFAWILGVFNPKDDGLSLSQVQDLIYEGKVQSFVIDGSAITLKLKEQAFGKMELRTTLANPDAFMEQMMPALRQQGIEYNQIRESGISPYDFIIPIILAGLALIFVWIITASLTDIEPINEIISRMI